MAGRDGRRAWRVRTRSAAATPPARRRWRRRPARRPRRWRRRSGRGVAPASGSARERHHRPRSRSGRVIQVGRGERGIGRHARRPGNASSVAPASAAPTRLAIRQRPPGGARRAPPRSGTRDGSARRWSARNRGRAAARTHRARRRARARRRPAAERSWPASSARDRRRPGARPRPRRPASPGHDASLPSMSPRPRHAGRDG